MAATEIELVPCRSDNYAVLVHDPAGGTTVLVDAPDAGPVRAALERRGWRLSHILVTHHHGDHVAGIPALKAATGAEVIGPAREAQKIGTLDRTVSEGDVVAVGPYAVTVFETPGHTLGHVSYWFQAEKLLFAGDTLFALGCGRLLEGTPSAMWASLKKLAALPADTAVYCGHEYTQSNARFAVTIAPDHAALAARKQAVDAARADGRPTIPSTIGEERATNPFLMAADPAIAARLGLAGADPVSVFAEIRRRKDAF